MSLQLDHLQEYIDRSWIDEGFDDKEEEYLLDWKSKIPSDLRLVHHMLEVRAEKKGLPAPPPLGPIPKIFFGIMKAKVEIANVQGTNVEVANVEAAKVEATEQ